MSLRVAFGCAPLGGRIGERASRAILTRSFELGTRHFDVAPAYGRGCAEKILGRFRDGDRYAISVTSKFGIEPTTRNVFKPLFLAAGRIIRSAAPGLGKHVTARASARRVPHVTPQTVRNSVERSLAALRTERIDTLLFHECTREAALSDDVRAVLLDLIADGKVGQAGLATDAATAAEIVVEDQGKTYSVVQCANSVFEPVLERPQPFSTFRCSIVTHSAFGNAVGLERLERAVARSPDQVRALADQGVPLDTRDAIAAALLRYALATNPNGMVIISTTSRERLERNCQIAMQPCDMPPVVRRLLVDLAATEGN